MAKDVLCEIRKNLESRVGEKIRLKANRGDGVGLLKKKECWRVPTHQYSSSGLMSQTTIKDSLLVTPMF